MITLLRLLYNLAFPVVLVLMLPSFVLRMLRRGNYRHKFGQRFGIYSRRVLSKLEGYRWTFIHAVSVGEVMIALKLITEMRKQDPELRVVLSTTTSTGYRLAHRHKSPLLEPIYHPLDLPWVVRHALKVTSAQRLILVEAEVWPNMMAAASRIPKILVNARLSVRSEKRYHLVRPFAAALFNQLDTICVQEPADAKRWEKLGVKADKIRMTGSIKFDPEPPASATSPRDFRGVLEAFGISQDVPVLLGGSTFDGEEILLAGIARGLQNEFPGLLLILVPRHAERSPKLFSQLTEGGYSVALRSEPPPPVPPEILLVNTTGELRDWYACATVVFIGKSLTAHGGQNPAEAIAAGKPVLFGPNMQNFASLTRQMLNAGGAIRANSGEELANEIASIFRTPGRAAAIAEAAASALDIHRGATARTVVEILQ